MKEITSVDYVASEMELFEDDGLSRSTSSLKITVNDETDGKFVGQKRASSNSNFLNINNNENETATISHARSENMIPLLLKKKNRLISTDSGFGSYGPYDLYNSGSVDNCSSISSAPKYTSIHSRAVPNAAIDQDHTDSNDHLNAEHAEHDDKVLPLLSETSSTEASAPNAESTPKAKDGRVSAQKKRNTTLNSMDDNFELDPKLINRDDGFHEVQCFINDDGSPVVREKRRRATRKKSTLKEELRARSLGASYDDNLLRKDTNKTPTCVSFSRLFKKLRETFCKFSLSLSPFFARCCCFIGNVNIYTIKFIQLKHKIRCVLFLKTQIMLVINIYIYNARNESIHYSSYRIEILKQKNK